MQPTPGARHGGCLRTRHAGSSCRGFFSRSPEERHSIRKPPLLIKFLSYIFMYMGVVALYALVAAWQSPDASSEGNWSVCFLTNRINFAEYRVLYTATTLFFVFSGITGLSIITKRSFAYDLAIACCIVGLVYFGTLIILRIGLVNGFVTSMMILGVVFGWFLLYFALHRAEWKSANKLVAAAARSSKVRPTSTAPPHQL